MIVNKIASGENTKVFLLVKITDAEFSVDTIETTDAELKESKAIGDVSFSNDESYSVQTFGCQYERKIKDLEIGDEIELDYKVFLRRLC